MGQIFFFLSIKFNKKIMRGVSDVLPQFACSMALIGMELLGTLEGYLSSATFDVYPVAERHQMVIGSLALLKLSLLLVFLFGQRPQ